MNVTNFTLELWLINDSSQVREQGNAVLQQISQMRGKCCAADNSLAPILRMQPIPGHANDSVNTMETTSPAGNVVPLKLTFSPGQAESDTSNIM